LVMDELTAKGWTSPLPDLQRIQEAARNLDALLDRLAIPPGATARGDFVQEEGGPGPAVPEASPLADPASGNGPKTSAGRLLVVDDNELNLEMLSRRLRSHGYEVSVARDGSEALRASQRGGFDAVLLDVVMPVLSGLDVLRSIRERLSAADLPVIMTTAQGESDKIVEALRLGANDYVTKPLDFPVVLARVETHIRLKEAKQKVERLAKELEKKNRFIQKTFGRYLSDDVVSRLLSDPEGLLLGGEKRTVTILMADLRGFTTFSEETAPERVMAVLNSYLGTMTRVINRYRGTIDEFIGDAVLALFGAPFTAADDATRAVACALEMQIAMDEVNDAAVRRGLPPLEMGIALNTGEVLVGNIGSEERAKYGVVGSHVNLAGRIESFSVGGQILISESTRKAAGDGLVTGRAMTLNAKGFRDPVTVHELLGIGPPHNLVLPPNDFSTLPLRSPLPIHFSVLTDKRVEGAAVPAEFTAICLRGADMRAEPLPPFLAELRIEMETGQARDQFFGKVVERFDGSVRVRFTSVPATIVESLKGLVAAGSG
ncbi:MAG TPA: adenylate/guanylate cyclase domain-containing protein, partial [Thermoanaerobaculia bacterium]